VRCAHIIYYDNVIIIIIINNIIMVPIQIFSRTRTIIILLRRRRYNMLSFLNPHTSLTRVTFVLPFGQQIIGRNNRITCVILLSCV